jgi:cation-transporting ATPase 13A1
MITGDNPLTACHVAKELRFTRKPLLVLTKLDKLTWEWISVAGDVKVEVNPKQKVKDIVKDYDFCITGEGLMFLNEEQHDYLVKVLPYVTVFAR